MIKYHPKQYGIRKTSTEAAFYILCKGKNAGKPLNESSASCFVCWICYALWKGKTCERDLIGSVIPYIRIQTMDNLIQEHLEQINPECPHFKKHMLLLKYLEQNMQNQLNMIEKLKQLEVAAAAFH